ncbi:MAG TPA: glycosyltransferase family 1 protein [Kiritimatiellia bacterium]|nr:glycosyltransferase family 1 protein [Kiritimatiellia bacterium]HRZ13394.1 glycosyltransferase family 1 protein [Kiritimatiellia bacterium]HSA18966.1 glycosyltransferase family 1 protein [Kiritimatiellia bacterium]
MKVCVDIQAAVAQRAGVGRYTKSLVEHLGLQAGDDALSLFFFDFKGRGDPFPVPNATRQAVRWCPGMLVQQAWKRLDWPPFDWFAGRADVYHFPNFIVPPLARGKAVVTIHDLAFQRFPETTERRNLDYLTAQIGKTVQRADAIIAVSNFVAHEIHERLGVPESRIFAIPSGMSSAWAAPCADSVAATQRELGLDRPYLLTVGTLEPRKNIGFLVEVFERMKFDGDLVIAGAMGWKYEPILDRIRRSTRAPRIRHLRYVTEKHLAALYAGAELFVFPSLYEGFGFTPLEAMACGVPVVAATTGSLPEVLGEAAELVAGYDAGEWTARADRLLTDTARRAELKERGFRQARRFSWDETARRTWQVYRGL